MKAIIFIMCALMVGCASKRVTVKKDTCKEIYGGTLMECDVVTK